MKITLLAASAFFCIVLPMYASAQDWKLFYDNGDKYYIDKSSVRTLPDNGVIAREKVDQLGKVTYYLIEMKCPERMIIYRQIDPGANSMFTRDNNSWKEIQPNELDETRYSIWCQAVTDYRRPPTVIRR